MMGGHRGLVVSGVVAAVVGGAAMLRAAESVHRAPPVKAATATSVVLHEYTAWKLVSTHPVGNEYVADTAVWHRVHRTVGRDGAAVELLLVLDAMYYPGTSAEPGLSTYTFTFSTRAELAHFRQFVVEAMAITPGPSDPSVAWAAVDLGYGTLFLRHRAGERWVYWQSNDGSYTADFTFPWENIVEAIDRGGKAWDAFEATTPSITFAPGVERAGN